jgi:hypothetical protein
MAVTGMALVAALGLLGCGQPAATADGSSGLAVSAVSAPTCPVERIPPDPACAPRPVPGAEIRVLGPDDREVARVRLDGAGRATVALVPGDYLVEALPVAGLLGTPARMPAVVEADRIVAVELVYDTGIR